ncbi:SDR family NAD(P)-dependent oxidoreductase [Natrinema sp. CGMCC1.2065]|uniref:SDR family NAD(P)-dependent oxidoreductase n=1 Tax=Natrinema sp. CGMCC1.2065 TaxID=3445767 RepID=UPI003F4A3968
MAESLSRGDGAVVLTGATGTIGSEVATLLCDRDISVVSVGRTEPPGDIHHVSADFTAPDTVARAVETLRQSERAFRGAVLCAGVDSFAGGDEFDSEAARTAVQVNAVSQLRLLSGVLDSDLTSCDRLFRVSLASTDLLSDPAPDAAVYAMSKRTLETGLQFVVEDFPDALAVTAVRLPYVGVPMKTVVGDAPEDPPLPSEPSISPTDAAAQLCNHLKTVDPGWRVAEAE